MVTPEAPSIAQSTIPGTLPVKGKRRHMVFTFLPQMLFILLVLGLFLGGGYWLLMPIVFLMVIVPLLDLVTGWQDNIHFSSDDFSRAQISLFHWNTRLYAVLYM